MTTDLDEVLLRDAITWSALSKCKKRKVGAVLAIEGRAISSGYNGTFPGTSNDCEDENGETLPTSIHAEVNCIGFAARRGIPVKDSTMYCTLLPCPDCAKLIGVAGIKRLVYAAESSAGLVGKTKEILKSYNIEVEQYVVR